MRNVRNYTVDWRCMWRTPREIARMFNKTAVDITQLEPSEFDKLGEISATDLGQFQALLDDAKQTEWGIREVKLKVNGQEVRAATAYNLGACRRLLEQVQTGESPYKMIRICS